MERSPVSEKRPVGNPEGNAGDPVEKDVRNYQKQILNIASIYRYPVEARAFYTIQNSDDMNGLDQQSVDDQNVNVNKNSIDDGSSIESTEQDQILNS